MSDLPPPDASALLSSLHPAHEPVFRAALVAHELFAKLPAAQRDDVVASFELREISALRWLFKAGDASDGLFIVLAGRCRAVRGEGDAQSILGEIGPGEIIGEAAALIDGPRTASVAAMRDTIVAWLPQTRLQDLLERHPALWRTLGRIAVERSIGDARRPKAALTLVLRPAHVGVDVTWVVGCFRDALARFGSVAVHGEELGAGRTGAELASVISEASLAADTLILVAAVDQDDWSLRCLRSADRVVLVADSAATPWKRDRRGLRTLLGAQVTVEATSHLVLLQAADATTAVGTEDFLQTYSPKSHHHVRLGNAADAARAARLVAGRGLGVVFGGASSRGIAHAGIVKALQGLRLEVDAVAGSSSGAGAAIGLASGEPADLIVQKYLQVAEGLTPRWHRYVPPLVAMMSGRDAGLAFQKAFAEVQLEDLLVPCTTTAVDVKRAQVVYLTKGKAWLAARATSSLPGFWPPVAQHGQVLVDGGIAANLPIDALSAGCGDGFILVVDLLPGGDGGDGALPFDGIDEYGHEVSGWRLLFQSLWPGARRPRIPGLLDLLIYVATIPNTLAQRTLQGTPSPGIAYLRPPLRSYGFFEVGPAEGEQLAADAEAYAREALPVLLKGTPFALT